MTLGRRCKANAVGQINASKPHIPRVVTKCSSIETPARALFDRPSLSPLVLAADMRLLEALAQLTSPYESITLLSSFRVCTSKESANRNIECGRTATFILRLHPGRVSCLRLFGTRLGARVHYIWLIIGLHRESLKLAHAQSQLHFVEPETRVRIGINRRSATNGGVNRVEQVLLARSADDVDSARRVDFTFSCANYKKP